MTCSAVNGGKLGHIVKGIYMGSEVKKSECHVKIGVKYRGETILKTRYSTFFSCVSSVHYC